MRNLFSVLILLLKYESKTDQGIQLETWKALLSVTNKLERVKAKDSKGINASPSSKSYSPLVKKVRNSFPISPITPTNGTGNSFNELPAELVFSIIEYISDQETLFNLLRSNRRMKNIILPIIYNNPYLTSPKSIFIFLETISTNRWEPASISFGPTTTTNLSKLSSKKTQIFEFLPYVHSGLFNHLIHDRDSQQSTTQLVHPIFYKFAKLTQTKTIFEEYGYHKEKQSLSTPIRLPFLSKNKLQLSQIPSSSMTLQNLFETCRKWDQGFEEWEDLKTSLGDCLSTSLLLLEFLQGDFYPIWHLLGGQVILEVKPLILRQCRELLSHIYQSLLLQVRFITANSQRLLDCYCLIYYKVLSVAQLLDVQGLFDAISFLPSTEFNDIPSVPNDIENILKIPQVRMESDDPDLNAMLPSTLPDWNKVKENIPIVNVNSRTTNQIIARKIYDSLIMIFHFRIPSELQNTSGIPLVPVSILRDILVTFPPSSVNKETVEFIQPLTEMKLIPEDLTTPGLDRWLKWLKEIIVWNEASVEMEPVKDLLRKSMDKIDQLRTIQV
jgi:hypothetical protein